jgi:sulfide:quinone oxidoreductase
MPATNGTSARHVVVAGASFAGLGAAYTLRERLRPEDRVTVIAPNESFVFAPSLVWAALGRSNASSRFALEPALRRKNIEFIHSGVREVDAAGHTLRTDSDQVSYEKLVIATGGRPDTSAIPGLAGEFRAASWIVNENSAMEARNVLRQLFNQPGPLVIGAAQGASYISAAYELALALDAALRREGLRERVPITFVTAEPFLGHLGFGQTAARDRLQKLFSRRNIETRVGVEIKQVQADGVKLSNCETVVADAIVVMPPLTGAVEIWKSSGLTDETGMIKVTPQYRHLEHPDIYASGVASYFSEPIQPLGYAHPPHTGYLSLRSGVLAGENVAASLDCGEAPERVLPRTIDVRVLDGGTVGLVLRSRGDETLHNRAMVLPGWAGHRLKGAIERYLVWQLRTGRMPSI